MGNLLGEPFKDYVHKEINERQKVHGKINRTMDDIKYLNSRNAWLKLASSVEIDDYRLGLLKKDGNPLVASINTGRQLALQNVLFNGLTQVGTVEGTSLEYRGGFLGLEEVTNINYSQKKRSGITGDNRAYGIGSKAFGFAPMPGIIDADIQDLNRGSIKKATINIKAFNKDQFDIIDVLYLRLGYTILLEWGFDKYLKNGTLQNMSTTLADSVWFSDKYKKSSYSEFLPIIEKQRARHVGNYDALFGVISNFSWTFADDGSYNIKLEIMSQGDIIESLKVNLPPQDSVATSYSQAQLSAIKANPEETTEQDFYNIVYPGLDQYLGNFYGAGGRVTQDPKQYLVKPEDPNVVITTEATFRRTSEKNRFTNSEFIKYVDSISNVEDREKYFVYGLNRYEKHTSSPGSYKILEDDAKDNYKVNLGGELYQGINQQASLNINSEIQAAIAYAVINFYSKDDPSEEDSTASYINKIGLSNKNLTKLIYSLYGVDAANKMIGSETLFTRPSLEIKKANSYILSSGLRGNSVIDEDPQISLEDLKEGVYKYFKIGGKIIAEDDVRFTSENKSGLEEEVRLAEEYRTAINERQNRNILTEYFYKIRSLYQPGQIVIEEGGLFGEDTVSDDKTFEDLEKKLPKIFCFEEHMGNPLNPISVEGGSDGESIKLWAEKVGYPSYSDDNKRVDFMKLRLQPDLDSFFIRLGTLLEFIQDQILPVIVTQNSPNTLKRGVPILKIDTDINTNICYATDNPISLDITKCLVKNSSFFYDHDNEPAKLFSDNTGENIQDFLVTIAKDNDDKIGYGRLMNIYFNFSRIEQLFDNVDDQNNLTLFSLLKSIMDDINSSLGNVNNLEPVLDQETNTVKFIDQSAIRGLADIAVSDEIGLTTYKNNGSELQLFGYEGVDANSKSNFIRNVGLTTEINKDYASMITIGATANGYSPGVEATAFSNWNRGIRDRYKQDITSPQALSKQSDDGSDEESKLQKENQNIKDRYYDTLQGKFKALGLNKENDKFTIDGDLISNNKNPIVNFYKFAQAEETSRNIKNPKIKEEIESSVGFLPFNLNITMDGLSGIKIYNRVSVNTKFLPSNYPNTLEFIIAGVNHKLSNNDWETSLKTVATSKSV